MRVRQVMKSPWICAWLIAVTVFICLVAQVLSHAAKARCTEHYWLIFLRDECFETAVDPSIVETHSYTLNTLITDYIQFQREFLDWLFAIELNLHLHLWH